MDKKLRLGIIGAGNMGSKHLSNILAGKCPEIEVTAVADRDPAKLERVHAVLKAAREDGAVAPDIACYSEGSELIAEHRCNAVLVAVPHYQHPGLTIEAMRAGLHVMCEKPAGVYTLDVRRMIAEADRHPELVFGMMFNQRTNHVYRKMHEIVASGALGKIRRTSWIITSWYRPQFYYDSGDWRATWSGEGGGVLLNQCPHQLDLWQWICGMPAKLEAKMYFGKWHDIEVEDDVSVFCEYKNGATGTFITSTGDVPGTNRFEIVCDGGTLLTDSKKLWVTKLEVPESVFTKENRTAAFGAPKSEKYEAETDGKNPQHVGVLNAFAGAVLHGTPLVADGREGINGLMISNAMHLSAWLGKEVSLPIDEALFRDKLMEHVAASKRKASVAPSVVSDTEGTY